MEYIRIFISLGIMLIFMLFFACLSEDNGNDSFYSKMIARSLISGGNNYRIKRVMEKAANGEDVTIAYIGGSITEGYFSSSTEDSYAYLAYESFKSLLAGKDASNIHFVNAGMAGTPSTLGIMRYKRDVLKQAPTPPDLVFIEFAVNDGDDPTAGATYESLVRDILAADNNPAVVLLFCVFQSQWNLQDRFIPIGKDYQLPMISIKDAIMPELDSGNLTEEEFFHDIYHPTTYGHKIMADCITYYFSTVEDQARADTDIAIPNAATIGIQFCGAKMIDAASKPAGVTIDAGSFTSTDTVLGTFRDDPERLTFPDNWYKDNPQENNSFTVTLNCKNFLLVYKKSSSSGFGTAEVYVDRELLTPLDGNPPDAWNNPYTIVLFDEELSASHTVKIRMDDESAAKSFSLLALGYTE
jgi:lysophospholipase L1-like esterase